MKSFSQFWEEVSVKDLEKAEIERSRSNPGRRSSAESEAEERERRAAEFTQTSRSKALSKRDEIISKFPQLKKKVNKPHRAKPISTETTKLVKGTAKLGMAAVRGVRNVIRKRKDNSQTGT